MRLRRFAPLVLLALAMGCNPQPRQEYLFVLRSADGLRRDSAITFLGIQVGYLAELRISPDGQSVIGTGRITDHNMRLLQGDTVRIELAGFLGDPQIAIIRGPSGGLELPVGSKLDVAPLPKLSLPPEKQKQVAEQIGNLVDLLTNAAMRSK